MGKLFCKGLGLKMQASDGLPMTFFVKSAKSKTELLVIRETHLNPNMPMSKGSRRPLSSDRGAQTSGPKAQDIRWMVVPIDAQSSYRKQSPRHRAIFLVSRLRR
jgi:hypothetical protein